MHRVFSLVKIKFLTALAVALDEFGTGSAKALGASSPSNLDLLIGFFLLKSSIVSVVALVCLGFFSFYLQLFLYFVQKGLIHLNEKLFCLNFLISVSLFLIFFSFQSCSFFLLVFNFTYYIYFAEKKFCFQNLDLCSNLEKVCFCSAFCNQVLNIFSTITFFFFCFLSGTNIMKKNLTFIVPCNPTEIFQSIKSHNDSSKISVFHVF